MQTLLDLVRDLIVRLYALDGHCPNPAPYIIGDAGLARFYSGAEPRLKVGASMGLARVLVRPTDAGALRLAIYYPDSLIAALEARNPAVALCDGNIDAFAAFVEEIDHFLMIADRFLRGRELSLFELELHAFVTKHYLARHFLKRQQGGLDEGDEAWLAYHLFHKMEFTEADAEVRARYHDARRLAWRYLRELGRLTPRQRLWELRSWSDASAQAKVARIGSLEAGA